MNGPCDRARARCYSRLRGLQCTCNFEPVGDAELLARLTEAENALDAKRWQLGEEQSRIKWLEVRISAQDARIKELEESLAIAKK